MSKNKLYQIQISLKNFKPKIWRRILIPSNLLLSDFHKIIQTTMGWTNSHLHQFIKDGKFYCLKVEDDNLWDSVPNVDYFNMKISDLLSNEKEKIIYEYDFGDGWQHEILLEKILAVDDAKKYPICLKGKMSCPPEDCGGVWGYKNLIDILSQPDHEEFDCQLEWIGEEFDPGYFNVDVVNQRLQADEYGCIEMW